MTTLARYAAIGKRLMASVGLGTAGSCQVTAKAASGPARGANPLPRNGGDVLTLRMRLLIEGRRARDLRQSKLASLIEADLRALNHEILRRGPQ